MADIQVTNTDSDLSGHTLLTEERPYTITGLHTYNRGSSPPFAVASGAAKVDNLDADKLDGQTGTYYLAAANATGTLSVAQGGTGATSLTDGGLLLGSGTGALTALGVAANGQIPIGDGSGDPQLATISGTSNQIDVTNGAASITLSLSSSYVGQTSITTLGTIATGTWEGTDIGVAHGGTGVSTLTDGGILLGSGTGAITALGVATNGQIPIGDGSGDPQLATISGTSNQIDVTNGAGSITLALSSSYVGQTSITTLGTIGTGTWEGTDVAVAHGGTGVSTLTDNAILMGNGTSAISGANGISGHDSQPLLTISGAGATLELSETATTPDEVWKVKTTEASGDSYLQINKPDGGTALSFHKTGYQVAYADGVNAYYYNAAGSSEQVRFGASGISFNGGTNYLSAVPVPVAEGGTGASSLTNTAILMGKGTSAVTPAHGIYGYDSYAILNHQGAGAAVYLTDTNSTRQLQITHQQNTGTTSILKMYGSAAAYGTGNNLTYLDTGTGEQTSLASGNNLKLTNFAGTEHMRLGPDGISFNGGTDDMDYEVGSYTAKLYGSTTGDSTHVVTATNHYIRIGKLVFVHVNFSGVTCPASATGVRTISLPFANYSSTGGGAFLQSNVTITGARTWTNAYFYLSTILCYSSGDDIAWDDEDIQNDAGDAITIQGSFSYRTT